MSKIKLIIGREYLTRVKKKSFIIMTILAPILLLLVYAIPFVVAYQSAKKSENKEYKIGLINESGFYDEVFTSDNKYTYLNLVGSLEENKTSLDSQGLDYLLYIPKTTQALPEKALIYSNTKDNSVFQNFVQSNMKKELDRIKLQASGIDPDVISSIKSNVTVETFVISSDGTEKKSSAGFTTAVGAISGLLIYMFIFMYGSQVMRGVMEEKSNRIVEIIMSSVKPFQLMMGKIVGIGLVGLTQFVLWIVLSFGLISTFSLIFIGKDATEGALKKQIELSSTSTRLNSLDDYTASLDSINLESDEVASVEEDAVRAEFENALSLIHTINFPVLILSFLFYFIFGYLLYAALFAAIGGAVDNETDNQQFMLPITIPLILPLLLFGNILNDPNGPVSTWLSIIPFTSPISMMARIPFGVPIWQAILSMGLLVLFFILITWFAGRIYRVGILMYGKKVTWKELWKWFRYSN
ncbi:MAG: ABC transporter permease [Bacteroidales bacterium]|jgi:ABC-2 type transport system permease protein